MPRQAINTPGAATVGPSRRLWPIASAHGLWRVGLSSSLLVLSITGAFVLIGLSSWYMLRED
jgi:hypothetical protein